MQWWWQHHCCGAMGAATKIENQQCLQQLFSALWQQWSREIAFGASFERIPKGIPIC